MLKMKMINIEAYIQHTNLTNLTQSNLMCWFGFGICVFLFFILFFSTRFRETNLLFTTVSAMFMHCSSTVYILFMGPTVTLFRKKKLKNESHSTIHTFKNYFVTMFSVFSFSKNKFNPNGPNMSFQIGFFFFFSLGLIG